MKYYVMGFSQELLIKYDVKPREMIILQYIMDAQTSTKMYHKSLDDNTPSYVWLTRDKILEDLPMLDVCKKRLSNIMIELKTKGLIETFNEPNLKGSKTFYRVSEKTLEMTAKDRDIDSTKTVTPESTKTVTPYSTINTYISSKLDIQDNLDNIYILSDLENREENSLENNTNKQDTKTNGFSKYDYVRELCKKEIEKYTRDPDLRDSLVKFLDMRIEKWKTSPKATMTVQSFKSYLKRLDTLDYKIEVVDQSTRNEWNTFYEIKPVHGKPKTYNENITSDHYTEDEMREIKKWEEKNNVPSF